jgi:hypothetical protein
MKRRAGGVFVVCALSIAVVILAFTQVQLSALQEPVNSKRFSQLKLNAF